MKRASHLTSRRHSADPAPGAASQPLKSSPLQIAQWRIDTLAREATDGERIRRLSPRAIQVLQCLAEAGGNVVRRSELMEAVWSGVCVTDESLTQAVAELRRALGRTGEGYHLIETVPKAGYRLTAKVYAAKSHGPATGLTVPDRAGSIVPLPIDAHLAITEARRLARTQGVVAADEIERLVSEAIAIAPDAAQVKAEYAVSMTLIAIHAGRSEERLAKACAAAEQALGQRPDLIASHRAFGFVAGARGRMDLAIDSFSRALSIDADDFDTNYLAAQVCFSNGQLMRSMLLGGRAAELAPDDYRPAYNAARAAMKLGNQRRARELAAIALERIERRLAIDPDCRRFLSARAAAAAMTGRQCEDLEATIRRASGFGLLYDVVAVAHQGEIDVACTLLEGVVDSGLSYTGWVNADPISGLLGREQRFNRTIERMQLA